MRIARAIESSSAHTRSQAQQQCTHPSAANQPAPQQSETFIACP
jgi:hypothetical protein